MQSDGKIVAGGVAGASTVTGSLNGQFTRFALARYNSAGSLDTTFGKSGIATTSIGAQADAIVGIALDKEGRLLEHAAEMQKLLGTVRSELFHYEVRVTYDTPEVADSRRIVEEAEQQLKELRFDEPEDDEDE